MTVQSTPAFVPSFVTVAATFVMPLTNRLTGGAIEIATVIGETAVMLTMAFLDAVGSAVAVAIMATVFNLGILTGAV